MDNREEDDDGQLELPLDNKIYVEKVSATSDSVLYNALNQFDKVFIIGLDKEGFSFRASDGNLFFWNYALDRAKEFLMRQ